MSRLLSMSYRDVTLTVDVIQRCHTYCRCHTETSHLLSISYREDTLTGDVIRRSHTYCCCHTDMSQLLSVSYRDVTLTVVVIQRCHTFCRCHTEMSHLLSMAMWRLWERLANWQLIFRLWLSNILSSVATEAIHSIKLQTSSTESHFSFHAAKFQRWFIILKIIHMAIYCSVWIQ